MSCPYLYNVLYNNVQEIFIKIRTSQGPTGQLLFGVLIILHLLLDFFFLFFSASGPVGRGGSCIMKEVRDVLPGYFTQKFH